MGALAGGARPGWPALGGGRLAPALLSLGPALGLPAAGAARGAGSLLLLGGRRRRQS